MISPHMQQMRWKVWMLPIVPGYQPGLQSFARLSSQAEKMREEIVAFVLRSRCSPLTVGCSET